MPSGPLAVRVIAMSTLPTKRYTVEEFLDLEEGAAYKSQFDNGELFAMAGATLPHNQIALDDRQL
jgi:Uma2 family endonuclease